MILLAGSPFLQNIPRDEKLDNQKLDINLEVKLKLFDVLALDSDGNPIKNLTRDRFKIFIDGKEVKIGTFDIVDYASPDTLPEKLFTTAEPSDTSQTREAEDISGKRLFIIIFHNLPLTVDQRKEIADGITAFLDDNHTINDYYALYYFTGPTVKLLLPFTNDPQLIKNTVNDYYVENIAGFIRFLPNDVDWLKIAKNEFGAESMLLSLADTEEDNRLLDSMPPDNMDAKTIFEMNSTLKNLDILLRSFSSFKGRKEVLLFSESISLKRYNPIRGIKGKGSAGMDYDRLIQNARTNNIAINSFNVNLIQNYYNNKKDRIIGVYSTATQGATIKSIKTKEPNDLTSITNDTGGIYSDRVKQKDDISEKLADIYHRSSCVYYLGVYLNDLNLDKDVEHRVKIEVPDYADKIIYQPNFRLASGYRKVDDGDRFSQFLDALYGMKKYDSQPVDDSLHHFPYGPLRNLLISIYRLPLTDRTEKKIKIAAHYYNPDKMLDRQFNRIWNIKLKAEETQARLIVGIALDSGEYFYRYAIGDEENGAIKNAEYQVYTDSGKELLSSLVLFGTAESAVNLSNLLDYEVNPAAPGGANKLFKLNPEWNPLIYGGKLITPICNEPVDRKQEAYVMFMYNAAEIQRKEYKVQYELSNTNIDTITFKEYEPEKSFPGGWRRVTLTLPLSKILSGTDDLEFVVSILDPSGNTVKSEILKIILHTRQL